MPQTQANISAMRMNTLLHVPIPSVQSLVQTTLGLVLHRPGFFHYWQREGHVTLSSDVDASGGFQKQKL